MNAREVRIQLQMLLGVKADGVIQACGRTEKAFVQLAGLPDDAPWPPCTGAAFNGAYSGALRDDLLRLYTEPELPHGDSRLALERQAGAIREREHHYASIADCLVNRGAGASASLWVLVGVALSATGFLYSVEAGLSELMKRGWHQWSDWSLGGMLYQLEAWHGFEARRKGEVCPKVWGPLGAAGVLHVFGFRVPVPSADACTEG